MDKANPTYRTEMTPLAFIERAVRFYPNKEAVIYGDTRMTYAEFADYVYRFASALKAAGLKKGDRVAILCPNTPPMLASHFAVPLAGGVLVTINTRLSSEEVAYILNHCGARFLFVDTELTPTIWPEQDGLTSVETAINIVDVDGHSKLDGPDFDEFLATGSPEPIVPPVEDEEDLISINYTSGTTGTPKGVMFTHRGAYNNSLGEGIMMPLSSSTVFLWTVPMFHCNGWCHTWAVTGVGGRHVCLRKVEPDIIWELILKEGVTHCNGAPVVWIALLNHPGRPEKLDWELVIATGGAPPSPTLLDQLHAIGARVNHLYGLTETYGPHTMCVPQDHWSDLSNADLAVKNARQGISYINADPVRVVDEEMNDVPADGDTMGEVVMRGNNVMKGYYNEPEATAEAFRGGWFHSGDVGVMHPDGYIELRDRSKDIIISGAENISSIEVEQCIYRHDAVLEVAIIGVPHERWGETPRAYVTLKEGATATEEEIIAFCRKHIAHYKCPTSVTFCELPKTSTGKIQKYALRAEAWEGKEKNIQGA